MSTQMCRRQPRLTAKHYRTLSGSLDGRWTRASLA